MLTQHENSRLMEGIRSRKKSRKSTVFRKNLEKLGLSLSKSWETLTLKILGRAPWTSRTWLGWHNYWRDLVLYSPDSHWLFWWLLPQVYQWTRILIRRIHQSHKYQLRSQRCPDGWDTFWIYYQLFWLEYLPVPARKFPLRLGIHCSDNTLFCAPHRIVWKKKE